MTHSIHQFIKTSFVCCLLVCTHSLLFSQAIGNSVSITDAAGKTYTGVIKKTTREWFQIKYDNYDALRWFTANQFTLIQAGNPTQDLIGKSVHFLGTDGKTYTGIVKQVDGNKYLLKYDGYDFESWLDRGQFSTENYNAPVTTTATTKQIYQPPTQTGESNGGAALPDIYNFGNAEGWTSPLIDAKYKQFLQNFTAKDEQALLAYLQTATTPSAQFFALKSLLMGDNYETVTGFINQLNKHDEAYQKENCSVTNVRSIIQQWQYSCSVTLLQTYLADLCPRYAWEVKQIGNFDVISNDSNYAMAVQQKELLEKYGGVASARGDMSGKSIGIITGLNELVGGIINESFYAQEVNEPLTEIFSKIRMQLDRGINTPLLVGFTGSDSRHFILAMRYKKTDNGYEYLIYDPWDGKCDYVTESNLVQGSLYPLQTTWKISLDYYYPVVN